MGHGVQDRRNLDNFGFIRLLYDDNEHEKKREVDLEALCREARNPVGARRSWHIGGLTLAAKVLSSRRIFRAVHSALKVLSNSLAISVPSHRSRRRLLA